MLDEFDAAEMQSVKDLVKVRDDQINLLIEGIATIASQLGIINKGAMIGGPEALILVNDIIGEIVSQQNNNYQEQETYEGE